MSLLIHLFPNRVSGLKHARWVVKIIGIIGVIGILCITDVHGVVRRKLKPDFISLASSLSKNSGIALVSNNSNKIILTGPFMLGQHDELTDHPLDPLSESEIRLAKFIITSLRGHTPWVFKWITLKEPKKNKLLKSFLQNSESTVMTAGLVGRKALVMLLEPSTHEYYEAIVNLNKLTLEAWDKVDHVGAIITMEDVMAVEDIAFMNPEVVRRIQKMGYNRSQIVCDTWDAGYVADNPNYSRAQKLLQVYFYGVETAQDNFYAHPLDFVVYVDLHSNTVRGIENLPVSLSPEVSRDTPSSISVPKEKANYHPELLSPQLSAEKHVPGSSARLHPLKVVQEEGPSFKIHGNRVSWHNFVFRVGYNGREGVVLHHVKHILNNQVRPVLYRVSLSEILVTYGDPRPPYHRKKSLEMGEFKLGFSAAPLPRDGSLCLGDARYLDMVVHDDAGEPLLLKNSICLVEEDAGPLWAHYDRANDKLAWKRSQRLAVSFLATLGHSDYWISWRLYQDSTIELAVRLTGLKNTNLVAVDQKTPPPYGNLLSSQLYTQITQHTFAVRIDADVDSDQNSVFTQDILPLKEEVGSAANPYGNGIIRKESLLSTVGEARSHLSPETARTWKIVNPNKAHSVTGAPVSWKLVPKGGDAVPLLLSRNSPLRNSSSIRWNDYSMWALPYDDDQIYASGLWMKRGTMAVEGDGLWDWTQRNLSASLINTDVVLWHTFRITSVPGSEDWPVSSDAQGYAGFIFKPDSFFDTNPGL